MPGRNTGSCTFHNAIYKMLQFQKEGFETGYVDALHNAFLAILIAAVVLPNGSAMYQNTFV